jgi:hypothetical protein
MASYILSEKSVPNHSNSTTGRGHKKNAASQYHPNTHHYISLPCSENWCVQHQFSLNKFSLNKFSLNKFSLNKFSLNKFSLNKFSLNKFSPNYFKKRIGSP